MNAIEISKLTKTYPDGTHALNGVDLNIKAGSFFGLLGPNGAGKSTMIHSMVGLTKPNSGSAKVFGKDCVDDYREARHQIGFSPQDINLDWFLTVEQTLDFHGGYFGMPKAERVKRIDELLEMFSLKDKRNKNIRGLSGGMKRRLVIARAMMHRPKILILDEPTAGVDVELRLELWQNIRAINKQGTTILLTTHYIEEAEQLCDNIALINSGKIIRTGTSAQLKKHYKKKTLEDVYLELVNRGELTRSNN